MNLFHHPAARIGINIICLLVSIFFVYFGVQVLLAAYTLKEPVPFVLAFFSSNLIILISLALMAGFSVKLFRIYKDFRGRR